MQAPQAYRAYQYDSYDQQKLQLRSTVKSVPIQPNQVRVKVVSAAINPADYMILDGQAAKMLGKDPSADQPFGVGSDAAGIVVEVGSETKHLKEGDKVYTMAPMDGRGTVADYVVVDEEHVAIKPSNLNFDQAASLPLVALTSYQALFERGNLQNGETLLVLGGSSATGMVAIQLAHAVGAHVIATTSAKNADFVKSLGADQVIDYHTQKWSEVLQHHSVDVIYDCGMEPQAWNTDAQLILKKNTSRYMTLLPLPEPVKSAQFGATNLGFFSVYPSGKHLDEITKFVEKGELIPVIDTTYPIEKLPEALTKLRGRHARGKLVIQVNTEEEP